MSNATMKIVSNDGQEFEIDYDIIKQSKMLKSFYEADEIDEPITLSFADTSILKSIIEFCNHHKNDPEAEFSDDDDDDDNHNNDDKIKKDINELSQKTTISEWDKTFIQQFSVHDGTLFDIITAANILDIPILIHTLCKSIIYLIKGKSSQEIRDIFKLSELLDQTADNHSPSSPIDVKNK